MCFWILGWVFFFLFIYLFIYLFLLLFIFFFFFYSFERYWKRTLFLNLKKKITKDKTELLYSVFIWRGFFVGLAYFPHLHLPFIRLWSGVFLFCFLFTRHFYQYCSITNLCATLADRCISVVKPLKYFVLITRKRIIFLSIASLRGSTFAVCLKLDSKSTHVLVIRRASYIANRACWILKSVSDT